MKFAVAKIGESPLRDRLAEGIVQAFLDHGHVLSNEDDPEVQFVLNLAEADNPRPYRRRSRAVFVATFVAAERLPDSAPRAVYTLLVRSLSNLALYAVPTDEGAEVHFSTLESGFYRVPYDPEVLYQRIFPLASARLIIENDLVPDLPERYHNGTPITTTFHHALRCGETVTGLVSAAALVQPDKKLASVKPKSVRKKFKDKAFARRVDRDIIRECEKLDLELSAFLELSLRAMQEIAGEIGL